MLGSQKIFVPLSGYIRATGPRRDKNFWNAAIKLGVLCSVGVLKSLVKAVTVTCKAERRLNGALKRVYLRIIVMLCNIPHKNNKNIIIFTNV